MRSNKQPPNFNGNPTFKVCFSHRSLWRRENVANHALACLVVLPYPELPFCGLSYSVNHC